ncbi:MAG: class I SAM-dependent methyltransferase [Sphingomonas sp.]|nr:class I SAM-dependent methyltransferase [Sphingomonas sp.]
MWSRKSSPERGGEPCDARWRGWDAVRRPPSVSASRFHLPVPGKSLLLLLALASCRAAPEEPRFPKADREIAAIVSDSFSTEDVRDRLGEFTRVVELAGVKPGMWVADVGAGEGYYAVRLSQVVGPRGRVLAEDIVPEFHARLAQRVQRERLDNVAVVLGDAANPKLPARSFDRIFLVHMYHEVTSPYAFLWHLRPALKPGGQVIVVDANRVPQRHGFPPELLKCEFAAVGLQLRKFEPIEGADAYFAAFEAVGERPEPAKIRPCAG